MGAREAGEGIAIDVHEGGHSRGRKGPPAEARRPAEARLRRLQARAGRCLTRGDAGRAARRLRALAALELGDRRPTSPLNPGPVDAPAADRRRAPRAMHFILHACVARLPVEQLSSTRTARPRRSSSAVACAPMKPAARTFHQRPSDCEWSCPPNPPRRLRVPERIPDLRDRPGEAARPARAARGVPHA